MHPHPHLLDRDRCAVVVVDGQERFRGQIDQFGAGVAAIGLLVRGARRIGVPVAWTEQYPDGLGPTVPELREELDGCPGYDKLEISACAAAGWEALPADVRDAAQLV